MPEMLKSPELRRIRDEEVSRLVPRFLRWRTIFLPVGIVFLVAIVVAEPTRWRVGSLGVVIALLGGIWVFDAVRLRRKRKYSFNAYPMEVGLGLVMQTAIIWMTGSMESPLLVIWVPLSMISGIALGKSTERLWLLAGLTVVLWLMALSGLLGWGPRTLPDFLHAGPGFYNRPIYVCICAAVLNTVCVVASQLGASISVTIERMLTQAIGARQQALNALTERNEELVFMSAALAHELKNPLASIQGLAQLLEPGRGDPTRQASRHEMLCKEVARMRTTLDDLLNFSRPLGDLTIVELDPNELLQEITLLHEGMARARGVHILSPLEPVEPFACDGRKVKQALVNLLQNALEATPGGGTVRWIARREGLRLLLGIEDSGTGVDPIILQRIANPGVTTKSGGSGIGLTVARTIAEQHGGSLLLENLAEGGFRAVLCLALPPTGHEESDHG